MHFRLAGNASANVTTAREWSELEKDFHINTLEMNPVQKVVIVFQDRMISQGIILMSENSSVLLCQQTQEDHVKSLRQLTQDFCVGRDT